MRMNPLHVCLVMSSWVVEGSREARLLCLSIPRNPKVRQTFMGGPRKAGGVHIVRSAALRRQDTDKPSKDSGARLSCLCRNLHPMN